MNWRERLRVITDKDATGRELDDEMRFHIERQVEENIAAGMTPEEARHAALREFGPVEPLKEECRSARGLDWLEHLWQDLRCAYRTFRKSPGFAAAVVGITALGIGASSAVFSVVDRVLFRPLPYAGGGRLMSLGIRIPWLEYDFLTASMYTRLRRAPAPFTGVTSWRGVGDCDVTDRAPLRLRCGRAESTFLPVLGIEPALGRNYTAGEDQPGAPDVALISYALWKNRFGGQRDVLGRRLPLDGRSVLIVGVLPSRFQSPTLEPVDVLLPQVLSADPRAGTDPLRVYGRLGASITPPQARTSLAGKLRDLLAEIPPDIRSKVRLHVRPLRDLQTGDMRLASWMLLAAVLVMLAIACANVANLLLARSVARRQELAIRAALGAGRWRLVRHLLTESMALGLAGGLLGIGIAHAFLRLFVRIAPEGLPHLASAAIDGRVLLFAVAATLICGAAFGIAPALHAPKPGAPAGVRVAGRGGVLARRLLVGSQIAASLVLLACAGVLARSLWNLQSIPLGLQPEHAVTAQVLLGQRYATPASRAEFYEKLEARLARVSGVSVALSDTLPPGGVPRSQPFFALNVQGRPPHEQGAPGIVVWRTVTPGYFRTLGIPIVRGRAFTADDRAPGERSIIISASYARALFGSEDPIGRKMSRFPGNPGDLSIWHTIVGVSADVRNAGLSDRGEFEYYLTRRRGQTDYQDAPPGSAVVLSGRGSPDALEAWLRTEIGALDPVLPVQIRTFTDHLGELAARPRFQALLVALFAGIGVLLAAFGLYGLVSFLVAQREREIGVRLALGATPVAIGKMVLGDVLRWAGAGVIAGIAGAAAAAQSLRALLYHVSPVDPAAYLASAGVLIACATLAAVPPCLRAICIDPARTLRQE